MRGRQLDRQVTFQAKTVTTSSKFNAPKAGGWENYAEDLFANVQDVLPPKTEQLDQTINLTMRPARIRIRYRDDITSAMRVLYRGRTLEIVSGPVEVFDRGRWLEMIAQEYSSVGDPA